ncbi:glycoside hydrolase family 18 protein [Hortaea werneckii]|nr:glycoside hydrolase family 18 protein [Hortaea werneckii]KAI7371895.1 glycoside hydrolase family 18 protein [Hortaea werneckii]KAI7467333.1 glycoside hydrolase family 18 protein [Hortaea werneckii]KAI7503850.1 glycoside hydrolase family 18 protein [Hortaea werneckii]
MGTSTSSLGAFTPSALPTPSYPGPVGNYSAPTSPIVPTGTDSAYQIIPGKTYTASYTALITTTISDHGTASVATSAVPTYSLQAQPPVYQFDPDASDNLAVYWGQTPNTTAEGLLQLCENADVDIVILAFLNQFYPENGQGYPGINFGPACDPASINQQQKAPDLLDCTRFATQIQGCQALGKPVLLSLGGYLANTSFVSDNQAEHFAETLWNLFGAGREELGIRPFGPDVVLDGFDIDNENHNTSFYNTFATALRKQFEKDPKRKRYYISAAPQCPIPDESIPLEAMRQADFVWVQFYNNPSCNLNSTGFEKSVQDWAVQLANGTSLGNATVAAKGPKMYLGAPAFAEAGSGYVNGSELAGYLARVKNLSLPNLGGVMLWDGTMGALNVDELGASYLDYAKAAVQ